MSLSIIRYCFVSLCLLVALPVWGAEICQWVETTGEAVLAHVTPEEAQQLALRSARARAVEQVAGVALQAHTLVRDTALAGELIYVLTHGYVLAERVLRWERPISQESSAQPPLVHYRVHLRACVASQTGLRDPYFTVAATLDKTTFVAGEEARLRLQCSRDCYLTVLNLAATDRFTLLLPNVYQPKGFLRASETLTFPPDHRGLALVMQPLVGHRRDAEAFFIVATKQWFDMSARLGKRQDIPMSEVFRVLLALPAEQRAETFVVYEVKAP